MLQYIDVESKLKVGGGAARLIRNLDKTKKKKKENIISSYPQNPYWDWDLND